ncbi:hypothetical protein Agub_g717 [Astrephomene gubernaculifera]|uniref:RING-type domain-containing protein n=1 Tax=Astrephomene gubernaculifera TaxID=47775 RepID=A0AAD3HH41_9CHLO|nr:hypothetical protein Agub_g717 [Astrephomene gubernaculifera]
MLFFYFSSGHGGSWSIGPLIALLPILLQLAPYVLQSGLAPVLTFSWGPTEFHTSKGLISAVLMAVNYLLIPAIGVWGMARFVRWVRGNGGWRFLLRLLLQGYQAGGAPRAPAPQQRRQGRVTVEEVADALTKLPTETYMTPEQLAALPVHELKALLHGRGLHPTNCLEKSELVRQLLQHGGSSADSCSICCEDYVPAAAPSQAGADADAEESPVVLRVLRCGHRFHVECVDKWFLSATDYTRAPACPLCNAPLLPGQPSSSNGSRGAQ